MHRTLKIPEILHLTFQYTDARTDAACARVCQTWHSPALDVLWHTIPQLNALFCLLGPMEIDNHKQYYFTQPYIASECWDRFFFYATRTRSLCCVPGLLCHPHTFTAVALARPALHILPNLTHLQCDHYSPMLSTLLFLSPKLKSFSILVNHPSVWMQEAESPVEEAESPCPFTKSSELLKCVAARVPRLEHLEIITENPTLQFHIAIENTLSRLQALRSVSLGDEVLTPSVLSILELCPLLEVITQVETYAVMPDFIPPPFQNGAFPSLTEICFQNFPISSLNMLLQPPFPAARLCRLVVVSVNKETLASISRLLTLVGSHCPGLQTLDLTAPNIHTYSAPEVPDEVFPFTVLEPLLACTELTTLSITTHVALHLGNKELVQLVGALPRIRKLHLAPQPHPLTPHHAQLTLDVLPLLVRVLPEIQYLGIYIHPTFPTPLTSDDMRSLPLVLENLQHLVLGTDTLEYDPDDLAFFLAQATPPTCEILVEYLQYREVRVQYHPRYEMEREEVIRRLNASIKSVPIIRKAGVRYEKRIAGLENTIEELKKKVEGLEKED